MKNDETLNYLESHVDRSLTDQCIRANSLDQRAGVLLGFAGAIVALSSSLLSELSGAWLVLALLGVVAAVIAAGGACIALIPRKWDSVTPQRALQKFGALPVETARFKLLSTLADEHKLAETKLRAKGQWILWSAVAMSFGIAFLAIGAVGLIRS